MGGGESQREKRNIKMVGDKRKVFLWRSFLETNYIIFLSDRFCPTRNLCEILVLYQSIINILLIVATPLCPVHKQLEEVDRYIL